MNLLDIYKELKHDIQFIEDELFQAIQSDLPIMEEASVHLLEAGGKRIRPVFVLLGGQNGKYELNQLKNIAVALELIHMATLVHDDVIDNADTRRGKLTVKAKWDNKMAMYTGDFIFAKALQYLTQLSNPRIHQILSKSIVEMCLGEIEQIRALYSWDQSLKTYFLRIKRKTALLMAISCQLGAIACQAKEEVVQALFRYGYYVGMAFQVTDDILDFTGTEKQLGKPAGSDLLQGNITLPVLFSFRNPSVKQQVMQEFEEKMPNIKKVIQVVQQSSGIEQSREVANKYIQKAKKALSDLQNKESKEKLLQIAEFIEQRNF